MCACIFQCDRLIFDLGLSPFQSTTDFMTKYDKLFHNQSSPNSSSLLISRSFTDDPTIPLMQIKVCLSGPGGEGEKSAG